MAEVKKAMTVQEIREQLKKPRLITLPSGLQMKVRHLTPYDYLNEGLAEIPNEFFTFIVTLNEGGIGAVKSDPNVVKNFEIFEKFVVITLEKGVIEPLMMFKYEKEKAETHLLYSELDSKDQAMLVSEIIGKTEKML